MEQFTFKRVDPHETGLMEEIYRLRFQVYALECGFIDQAQYPSGMETDKYDPQSVHFAALNSFDEVVATVRMILPGQHMLPIQSYCPNIDFHRNKTISSLQFVEISRLIIRRKNRLSIASVNSEVFFEDRLLHKESAMQFFRRTKPLAFGLYREMFQECQYRGVTHLYVLMEKRLRALLRLQGLTFSQIGPEVNFFGPVHPHLAEMSRIEKELYPQTAAQVKNLVNR